MRTEVLHHETIIRVKWAKVWMLLSTGSHLSTYLQVRIALLQLDFGLELLEGSEKQTSSPQVSYSVDLG